MNHLTLLFTLLLLLTSCAHPPQPITQLQTQPDSLPGLRNIVHYTDNIISGAAPDADGFAALQQLGVKTIISVEAALPDVALAQQHNIRTVHVPVGYDMVTLDETALIARAIRDLPGKTYIHCSRGKHRSAAAAGAACVALDLLTITQAEQRMHISGTSPVYDGLWRSVRTMTTLTDNRIGPVGAPLPQTAEVSAFAQGMARVARSFDGLEVARQADWKTPAAHPDIVPANEARILTDVLTQILRAEQRAPTDNDDGFKSLLETTVNQAASLAAALESGTIEDADARFIELDRTCNACHKRYRY